MSFVSGQMSHTIKKEKKVEADKPVLDEKHRGHRPNKKKLTSDEIVKLIAEQGFG